MQSDKFMLSTDMFLAAELLSDKILYQTT
jgi:hypothetical protein